ncbi:multiple epidermal growth factor-like domains protein 10 [Crassostrea angulata]|uniref:multiple epidermal growth factor-like domains protein 10 n=1 Tax=Magallana angulata TaxID=2784310 RepID=UPI0022B1A91B|nr:multiple epidermal growth factor-like domains protein 10 [Crassostrea angulata]
MYCFTNRLKVLMFLIWIASYSDTNCLIQKKLKQVTKACLYGQYRDGNDCKECTVGYTGVNCSQKCVLPTYGVLCSRICNCSYCHHGMGCISTPSFTENQPTFRTKRPEREFFLGHHYNHISWRSDNTGATYVDLRNNTQISLHINCH